MGSQPYQIIWSADAQSNLAVIIDYLFENWNEKVVNNFLDKVDRKLNIISRQPFIGNISNKDALIRSVLISKHNRLYYSVYDNTIELLHILDTRQNPTKNPY